MACLGNFGIRYINQWGKKKADKYADNIIKVLQKRGYSWVDINQDYKLNTDQKYMSNSDGRMIFKWC